MARMAERLVHNEGGPEDTGPGKRRTGGSAMARSRRKERLLWDDAEFRRRVQQVARDQGQNVEELMAESGVAHDYCYRPADGRNTNVIMRIAERLNVNPAEIAGWTTMPSAPGMSKWMIQHNAMQTLVAMAIGRGESTEEIARAIGLTGKAANDLLEKLSPKKTQ